MGHTKKEYEYTLPVFPSLRRQLKEELEWENQKQDLDPRDTDEDLSDYYRELEEERFERAMNNYFESFNQI